MKQYTNAEQTAKLIELGFAPKLRIKGVCTKYGTVNVEHEAYFDVGKLIEMLPKTYDSEGLVIGQHYMVDVWIVRYPTKILIHKEELVDALYDMVVKLKEEGVI